ncbi:XRE family transcriptional regulator [Nocardiopsis rhodophaea]|uniref:helix-turn-helix domain-containing protein n=1 Tax=Nocardiopsis rhodophaea TaxID=280238 RepID=UPI0031DE4A9B
MVHSATGLLSANIRLLRSRSGLSLSALARKAGVSKATLSDLESGSGNPTIETVFSLARALDAPVSSLLREGHQEQVTVVRAYRSEVLSGKGVELRPLRREDTGISVLEVYDQLFRAGRQQDSAGHPGTEHTIVTSGRLTAVIDGREHDLGPGDSVRFPASLPHTYIPRGGDVDSVLILTHTEPHHHATGGQAPADH